MKVRERKKSSEIRENGKAFTLEKGNSIVNIILKTNYNISLNLAQINSLNEG